MQISHQNLLPSWSVLAAEDWRGVRPRDGEAASTRPGWRDGDGALFNFWWLDVPASVWGEEGEIEEAEGEEVEGEVVEGEGAVEGEGEGDDFPVAVGI